MGGGGGGEAGVVRYAPYIEEHHESFLNQSAITYGNSLRPHTSSPYFDYTDLNFDDAFYGSGFMLSSFPSLYDMFGKFIAGLDIEVLWDQVLDEVQNSSTIQNSIEAHKTILTDTLEQDVLPRFKEGYRDANAVMTSSFVIGKAILEKGIINKLAEFDANLRYKLLPVAAEVFSKHLAWNSGVVNQYIEVMKFAILTKFDTDTTNYGYSLKHQMWPFTVLEQERANLGALQGAVSGPAGSEPSTAQKVLGGALGGASVGASAGGVPGAVIGGVLGGIAGLF